MLLTNPGVAGGDGGGAGGATDADRPRRLRQEDPITARRCTTTNAQVTNMTTDNSYDDR